MAVTQFRGIILCHSTPYENHCFRVREKSQVKPPNFWQPGVKVYGGGQEHTSTHIRRSAKVNGKWLIVQRNFKITLNKHDSTAQRLDSVGVKIPALTLTL